MIHLLDDQGEEWKDETLTWRTHATIREDGTFTLPAMPPGELQLIAMCDGFVAQSGTPPAFASEHERQNPGTFFGRPQVFTVVGGANAEITLAMTPTSECEFHIADPDGKPIAGRARGLLAQRRLVARREPSLLLAAGRDDRHTREAGQCAPVRLEQSAVPGRIRRPGRRRHQDCPDRHSRVHRDARRLGTLGRREPQQLWSRGAEARRAERG